MAVASLTGNSRPTSTSAFAIAAAAGVSGAPARVNNPVIIGRIRSAVLISIKDVKACGSDNIRCDVTASMSVCASNPTMTFSDSHWMS